MRGFSQSRSLVFLFGWLLPVLLCFLGWFGKQPYSNCAGCGSRGQASAVNFSFNGTIVLTNPITISNNTALDATGQNITISGGGSVQLFIVNTNASLVLSNLALVGGFAQNNNPNQPSAGGAISNAGTVQITECAFLQQYRRWLFRRRLFAKFWCRTGRRHLQHWDTGCEQYCFCREYRTRRPISWKAPPL